MNKKDKAMLEKLQTERARLQRQIEALQNEVRGLDRAIALCSSETDAPKERPKNVKATVIDLVRDAGVVGMNVEEVMSAAATKGIHLERGTVASTLSRLKLDGQMSTRDGRYAFRADETPAQGWITGVTMN